MTRDSGTQGPAEGPDPGTDAAAGGADGIPNAADPAESTVAPASRAEAFATSALGSGMGQAVRAGATGESLSARSVLGAIGGWRGIAETIVPSLVFLTLYVFTQDARLSAIVPGVLAILLIAIRLVRREPLVSAISGMLGVGIAVVITLVTGRGVDYFLSGFVINAAYALALLLSILIGWPVLGFVIGLLRGDVLGWRKDPRARRIALIVTLLWLALFVARLAVQLPMYLAEQVEALGVARLVMGTPLFALVIVATWLIARTQRRSSSDDQSDESVDITGHNADSA